MSVPQLIEMAVIYASGSVAHLIEMTVIYASGYVPHLTERRRQITPWWNDNRRPHQKTSTLDDVIARNGT